MNVNMITFVKKLRLRLMSNFWIKKNKTKTIRTKGLKKSSIASQNRYELIKINKLLIIIEGTIRKNLKNTYMKCDYIPLLWRKSFLNIATKRDYVNNYCNRPLNTFDRHCHEWYLQNLIKKTLQKFLVTFWMNF